jgi:hypothetical protein
MKPDFSDTTASSPRRRWLGAMAAVAGAAWAWQVRAARTAFSTGKPILPDRIPVSAPSSAGTSANARFVVRPSPGSVKRHG